MPELPEVELVVRALRVLVKSRKISTARLIRERLAPDISPADFAEKLKSSTINFVHRRGKHILFDLDNGRTLITHLRMSGRFMLLTSDNEDPKFTHAVFYLDDETRLVFQDQRHFGFMRVVETKDLHDAKELKKLAPEPFSDDFSPEYLRKVLKTSKRSLKEFLIDQTKVTGLGNIYANEAMFLAGVDPRVLAHKLSGKKVGILFEKIRVVLLEAMPPEATLNIDPENIEGSYYSGGSESSWRVYDREKAPCPNCQTPIIRLKQGGRSTYYCPKCQKR